MGTFADNLWPNEGPHMEADMNRKAIASLGASALAWCVCAAVRAEDPLGMYLGGSIGQADLHLFDSSGDFYGSDDHFGWKAEFGMRPLPFLGGEVDYLDFGQTNSSLGPGSGVDEHSRGGALFGIAYLPMPGSFDVFGKAGLGRVQTTANGSFGCGDLPCNVVGLYRLDRTDTDFAYGAGAQVRVGSIALRGEYERISVGGLQPSLLSFGFSWLF